MAEQQCVHAGCTNGVAYLCHEHSSEAEQITTLRDQLKKHGGHTLERERCNFESPRFRSEDYFHCIKDCGWAEIEKGKP